MSKAEYYKNGPMKFNPAFHFSHGKPWLLSDEKYLIERYKKDTLTDISLAMGRTYKTIADRICTLKKLGKIKA